MIENDTSGRRAVESPEDDVPAVVVVSCDAYHDLWPPFFELFFRYWPDCPFTVHLGSNTLEYKHPRVRGIMVGPDRDYSSNLLSMLDKVRRRWVVLWLEDQFLARRVDSGRLIDAIGAAQRAHAAHLKLLLNHPFPDRFTPESPGAVGARRRYRFSLTVGLWRTDALKALLKPGESAWEFERHGARRSRGTDEVYLALPRAWRRSPPIEVVHGVIRGRWTPEAMDLLEREGFSETVARRGRISLWSRAYVRSYLFLLDRLDRAGVRF
jgi:hypothetical protein